LSSATSEPLRGPFARVPNSPYSSVWIFREITYKCFLVYGGWGFSFLPEVLGDPSNLFFLIPGPLLSLSPPLVSPFLSNGFETPVNPPSLSLGQRAPQKRICFLRSALVPPRCPLKLPFPPLSCSKRGFGPPELQAVCRHSPLKRFFFPSISAITQLFLFCLVQNICFAL